MFNIGFGFGFDLFTTIFPIMFGMVFLFVFGSIIFSVFSGLKTWKKNNDSPRLKVTCKIVDKRQDFRRHSNHNHNNNTVSHSSVRTTYYATFEVESGDRMELSVPSNEYGLFVVGDEGALEFQGTRYLGFQRKR